MSTTTRVTVDPWQLVDGFRALRDGVKDTWYKDALLDPWYRGLQAPRMNIWATENVVTVDAELPGVDPDKVDISIEQQVLTIRGEVPSETLEENTAVYRTERYSGQFERSVELPFAVDVSGSKATARNGILRVTLPKAIDARVKRIQVEKA